MKAYLLNETGGVENLRLSTIAKPEIAADEVLVEVKAISINPVDAKVRAAGELLAMIVGTEDLPVILGWDIAGVVAAVGGQVTGMDVGDRVFGMIRFPGEGKAYAEYVASPASHLARMPETLTFEDAAATTLAALTALQALRPRVKRGDRVLVHAGSGGVGHFAIQIAKTLGAYVISTSSAANRDFLLSLGTDEHIDYRAQKFEEMLSDVDLVLDSMGGDVLVKSLRVVRDGGKVVSLPTNEFTEAVQAEVSRREIELDFILVESNGADLSTLSNLLENGELNAHVSKVFSFDDMADAHRHIESGRTVGKIVVAL